VVEAVQEQAGVWNLTRAVKILPSLPANIRWLLAVAARQCQRGRRLLWWQPVSPSRICRHSHAPPWTSDQPQSSALMTLSPYLGGLPA